MPESIIYTGAWLISPHAAPVPGGALVVKDGLIIAAGALNEVKRCHTGPVVDYPGCAIVPGFINAHTHLELTHFPSWKIRTNVDYNPRRFVDWIIKLIKIRRGLLAEDYRHSVNEGIRMCLESGTTAIGEIVTDAALAPLYSSSPLTGRLYFELLGHDPGRFQVLLEEALAAAENLVPEGFVSGLSPHTIYTLGEGNMPLIRDAALTRAMPLSIHISESEAEVDFAFNSTGPLANDLYPYVGWERYLTPPRRISSTELLDRAGLLTPSTLAVHCVHVNRADVEILRQRGVSVALCLRSNERLDVGRAPVVLLKKLGIPLVLGTDSLASNDSLSLWDEMRFALDSFSRDLSPSELFNMVTSGGAAALGIAASHGSLEPGKRADFQVVNSIGDGSRDLLEKVVCGGTVEDIYLGGQRYVWVPA